MLYKSHAFDKQKPRKLEITYNNSGKGLHNKLQPRVQNSEFTPHL